MRQKMSAVPVFKMSAIRDPAINESIRIELSKQQEKFWAEREPADA